MIDPAASWRRMRRRLVRVVIPIFGVGLVIASILGIAWYSYMTNKRDALALAEDVIESQEARIRREVEAYLGPAPRAVELLRGVVSDGRWLSMQGAAEAIGWQVLYDNPQLALVSYASPDGSFMMVKREAGGAIDTKNIVRDGDKRRTTWTRRDGRGRTLRVEEEPGDTYDPRTRVWYKRAVESGKVTWSDLYIFFTDRKPGLTCSAPVLDANGRVAAVFGVDLALDSLSAFLAQLQIGKTGRAMIIDDKGYLVAYPDAAKTIKQSGEQLVPVRLDELGDPALTLAYSRFRVEGHGRRIFDVDGKRVIATAAPLTADADRDWSTLIVVPEADFVGFVALNNRSTLMMSLGVVGLTALFAALLIRQGLRADRNAALVEAREQAREAQSAAFAELATNVSLFDPAHEEAAQAVTRTVARVLAARRVSIWRASADGERLVLEDCRDRENDGHTAGIELARGDLPQFFAALEAGEEIAVADVASDARTADLHRAYLQPMGSRALIAIPVRREARLLGAVWIEDARADGALSFARAVANMVAVRFAAGSDEVQARQPAIRLAAQAAPAVRVTAAAPATVAAMRSAALAGDRSQRFLARVEAEKRERGTLAAQVFPNVTVIVVRFTDALTLAQEHDEGGRTAFLDRLARTFEAIAAEHGIDYLKILGEQVVAVTGFEPAQERPPVEAADAAIAIQERCARLFTSLGQRLEFRIGLDTGTVIGSAVGAEQGIYNLWGEAVRVASAMAESGPPGAIQVSEATYRLLREHYLFRARGAFYLERAGEFSTYLLTGKT